MTVATKYHAALLCAYLFLNSVALCAAGETQEASPDKRELVQGLIVQGTLKQVIGHFNTHGRPEIGDTLELEFDNLPQKMLKLKPQKNGSPYIPFSTPLLLTDVKQQSAKLEPPRRAVIHLAAGDANSKFLIQIVAESLERGSKVRIYLYQDGGFIGSMAEAEGVLK
jgi:hypothetical protein